MPRATSILLVEDDELLRLKLEQTLAGAGYEVTAVDSGESAVAAVARDEPDLALVDLNLPGMSGIDLCARMRQEGRDAHLLVMTAFTGISSAVEAIKAGAHDYLVKPLDTEGLLLRLAQVTADLGARNELRLLKSAVQAERGQGGLLGACPPMRRLFEQVEQAAQSQASALLTGESGTGKESLARALHRQSPRADGPFVVIDCSTIPDARLEEHIFGHGPDDSEAPPLADGGAIAEARGGTIFFTELCELPVNLQARLVSRLEAEAASAQTLGTPGPRVVSATNRSPEGEIEAGGLREDLYFQLNIVPLAVPPLRARGSDLPLLAEHFLAIYAARFDKNISQISDTAAERLLAYDWPGNVREFKNCIERAVALCNESTISEAQLPTKIRDHSPVDLVVATADPNDWISLEEVSMLYTRHVLRGLKGNKSQAARVLGVDRKTLARKLRRWDESET